MCIEIASEMGLLLGKKIKDKLLGAIGILDVNNLKSFHSIITLFLFLFYNFFLYSTEKNFCFFFKYGFLHEIPLVVDHNKYSNACILYFYMNFKSLRKKTHYF